MLLGLHFWPHVCRTVVRDAETYIQLPPGGTGPTILSVHDQSGIFLPGQFKEGVKRAEQPFWVSC